MKKYSCDLCGKDFDDRSNLYRHKARKNPCIAPVKVEKLANLQVLTNQLESKTRILEEETKNLKRETTEQKAKITHLEQLLAGQSNKTCGTISNVQVTNGSAEFNNCVLNNNTVLNNTNVNPCCIIKLAPYDQERYDHIDNDEILSILGKETFVKSLTELAEAVYFNPRAPENARWAITDKKGAFGAIEHKHDTNTLIRARPRELIEKNLRCLIDGMSDKFEELRESCTLNEQQNKNYLRYFTMIGDNDFQTEHVDAIKEMAYNSSDFTQGLWRVLHLKIETTEFIKRIPKRK